MFHSGSHCKFLLCYHVIFVTKFRRKCLTTAMLDLLHQILTQELSEVNCFLKEFNGESDHIHFLMETKPCCNLSSVIGRVRSKTTLAMRKAFKFDCYYGRHRNRLWSSGYFICTCGGVTIDVLKKYIENQERPYPP